MYSPAIGSLTVDTTARSIIMSIRDKIPDPVDNPNEDGTAFSLATLLRWLNDAMRIMCSRAPIIQDWYGIPSATGMDVYEIPPYINSVEQCWYNLLPLTRDAELNDIFTTKIQGRSWWFGPHSIHAQPRIHVWPTCDTTGASAELVGTIAADANSYTLNTTTGFQTFGFHLVGQELILIRNINKNTGVVTNILRGQGGTDAVAHNAGTPVRDCNIFFKCFRLPRQLSGIDDIIEVPQGLWPLLEIYVLAQVREAEQDHTIYANMMQQFMGFVDQLAAKSQLQGLRQGIQVRLGPPGPQLYMGRTYIP